VGVRVIVGAVEPTISPSVGDEVISAGVGLGIGGIIKSSQISTSHRPMPCSYAQHCSMVS
jgi:hypothetical protein